MLSFRKLYLKKEIELKGAEMCKSRFQNKQTILKASKHIKQLTIWKYFQISNQTTNTFLEIM